MKSDLHVPPQFLKQEEYRGQQVIDNIVVYLGDNNVNNQHEGHFSMYLSSSHTQLAMHSVSVSAPHLGFGSFRKMKNELYPQK